MAKRPVGVLDVRTETPLLYVPVSRTCYFLPEVWKGSSPPTVLPLQLRSYTPEIIASAYVVTPLAKLFVKTCSAPLYVSNCTTLSLRCGQLYSW